MLQKTREKRGAPPIAVIGAGIAGAWQALLFAKAGHAVTLHERGDDAMAHATSHWAGGMLAPWCECEVSEPLVSRLGLRSLELWREHAPDTSFNGSLVVAHPRDRSDFERFARMTSGHRHLQRDDVSKLEPSLDGRFREALFFPDEGHVEPRRVLPELHARIRSAGGQIEFGSAPEPADIEGLAIDCRGLAARDTFPDLRGVKGERSSSKPTRSCCRARCDCCIRAGRSTSFRANTNRFMIGATSIECEDDGVSVRSALELLSAAYAVHPAFGEARIVEIGAGLRPAFPDNLPRIAIDGDRIAVNGLYRHGFLLAPALAELTSAYVARGRDRQRGDAMRVT